LPHPALKKKRRTDKSAYLVKEEDQRKGKVGRYIGVANQKGSGKVRWNLWWGGKGQARLREL